MSFDYFISIYLYTRFKNLPFILAQVKGSVPHTNKKTLENHVYPLKYFERTKRVIDQRTKKKNIEVANISSDMRVTDYIVQTQYMFSDKLKMRQQNRYYIKQILSMYFN